MNISQRHVSFVERARARPSRDLIVSWIGETGSGQSAQNAALLIGGFSIHERECIAASDSSTDDSYYRLIDAHHPLPAFAFSADWRVRTMNRGARWLCSQVMPRYLGRVSTDPGGLDMIDACTAPDGLLSRMVNAEAFGRAVASQLGQEAHARASLGERLRNFERSLSERFGDSQDAVPDLRAPSLSVEFDTDHGVLRFVTAQSIVALPQDVTLDTTRIEFWFPTDEYTRSIQSGYTRDE